MIPPRELAAQLAGSIFDHVEKERNLVRHSIEEALHDALLLAWARDGAPTLVVGGAASQEVQDSAKRLCCLMVSDPAYFRGMHPSVSMHVDALYGALLRTGWHP